MAEPREVSLPFSGVDEPHRVAAPNLHQAASPADSEYMLSHRLPEVMEHLAFALLESKPEDHVAFTRRWLSNLRAKMESVGATSAAGINLFSIDGNKLQKFVPRDNVATGVVGGKHNALKKASMHSKGSSNGAAAAASSHHNPNQKSVDALMRVAEKLHKDDFATAIQYLQNMVSRRSEKAKREADETRLIRKFHTNKHHQDSNGDGEDAGNVEEDGTMTGGGNPGSSLLEANTQRRRIGISATPLAMEKVNDFTVTDVKKTAEEREKLMQCVEQCSLFTAFDEAQKELVVSAMTKQEFAAGYEILSQGEPGKETFYLVLSGKAEVIKDKKFIAPINPGQYFGELELMYNEPSCAATIKTITPVVSYGLGKETYQHIVLNATLERRKLFLKQIERVPIFEVLQDYDKLRVAEALTTQQCAAGDYLIRCGEPVHWMYIVMEGMTRVVGRDPDGKPVNIIDLGAGHVIGELEFIFHHNAVADVLVESDFCKVAKLNRHHFEMIIGNMTDEMKHFIATKDIYSHYMEHAEEKVKKDIEGAQQRARRKRSLTTENGLLMSAEGGGLGMIEPDGEILFAYNKSNVCRFPMQSLATAAKLIVVTLLEDGTVQQWNDAVVKATQYKPEQAIGQSIFSFLTSEEQQSAFHDMLRSARDWMGNWEGFVKSGLNKPKVFDFTQSDGLQKSQLNLTVVPGLYSVNDVADVYLAVGVEVKARPPATHIDLGKWLSEKLRPKLQAVSKLLEEGSEVSQIVLKKARQGVHVCDKVLSQFVRVAGASMDSIQETWRPVSIQVLFQRCLSSASASVRSRNNRITVEIDDDFPAQEVFVDIDLLMETLGSLIEDTNAALSGVDITLRAEVVGSSIGDRDSLGQTMSMANMLGGPSFAAGDEASKANDMKFLRMTVKDNGRPADEVGSIRQRGGAAGGDDDGSEENSVLASRGSHLSDIKHYVTKMGGMFTTLQEPEIECGTEYLIEIPLVLAEKKSEENLQNGGRTFTTVLVERNPVQRNNICQLLWTRRHAVLPVTTWKEVTKMVEAGTCDILVMDPECLRDDKTFHSDDGSDPFDVLRSRSKIAIIVMSADIDAEVAASAGGSAAAGGSVLQLPKPCPAGMLHVTFQKAENIVKAFREEEEKITALRNTFSETKRGEYSIGRLLGRGAFGEVHEVEDVLTGGKMAMKTMRLKSGADTDALVEEIRTMTQLQHENIIHYFYCEKTSESEIKIFMELAGGGTLQDKIKDVPGQCGLAHADIVHHLKDLLNGIEYIHNHRYVHCDIKTANALLDVKGRTKLGDFGTARKLKEGEKLYVMSGTPTYMAPEVMSADPEENIGYDMKADIWSLGCIVLEMATGQPPFSHIEGTQGMGIFKYISELEETPDLSPLFHASPLLFSFVKACLEPNPSKRPSAQELQKFSLLSEGGADQTVQAEKLVKRAQLLHVLSKFVAFQDEECDSPTGTQANSSSRKDGGGSSFFSSDDDDDDEEPKGRRQHGTEEDVRISSLANRGGFFDSDDEDEDDDGSRRESESQGEGD